MLAQVGRDRSLLFGHQDVVLYAIVFDDQGTVSAVYQETPVIRGGHSSYRLGKAVLRITPADHAGGVMIDFNTRTLYYIDDWATLSPHLHPFGDTRVWFASRERGFVWGMIVDESLEPVKIVLNVWPRQQLEPRLTGCLAVTYTMSGDIENGAQINAAVDRHFGTTSSQRPPVRADVSVIAKLREVIRHVDPSILAVLKD